MPTKKKQPIKLMSNLRKISDLELYEKTSFMKGSIFYGLSKVRNNKEHSGTLVAALCTRYDATKKLFTLNNGTSVSFCAKEVARVLGLEDTGTDFSDYQDRCSTYTPKFPAYMYELRERFAGVRDRKETFTSSHLREILKNMVVHDERSKLQFRRLMSYYIIEQVLLCSSNTKKPRSSFWRLVNNLEMFESVNWSKATLDHLLTSVLETKQWLENNVDGQHNFKGAAPVLEAMVYERIPSLRPKLWSLDPPLVQRYGPQRKDAATWTVDKLSQLTPADIITCPHCGVLSGGTSMPDEDEVAFQDLSLVDEATCLFSNDAEAQVNVIDATTQANLAATEIPEVPHNFESEETVTDELSLSQILNMTDNPFAAAPHRGGFGPRQAWDIKEDDETLSFRIDMIGLDTNDVKISVEQNILVIKGEAEESEFDEEPLGKYFCRINMPTDAYKLEEIKAQMKNSVLKILIPKARKTEVRKDVFQVQIECIR